MPVLIGGYLLRPITGVDFKKVEQTLGDGRVVNSVVQAVVSGTIVPDVPNGVLTPVGDQAKLTTILEKQKEIRDHLAVSGQVFEVQGWDGQTTTKFNARVVDVEFVEGQWYNKCDYRITLEAAEFSGETQGNNYVESASEEWSFAEDEFPKTTKVSHTVRAKGRLVYDATGAVPKPAWQYARDFAQTQLGLGWTAVGATFSPNSGKSLADQSARQPLSDQAWNYVLNEVVGETDGTYEVTETWLLAAQPYFEEYQVAVKKVDNEPNLTTVVTVTGRISGFYQNLNDYDSRNTNAQAAWSTVQGLVLGRAQASAGIALNAHPTAWQVDPDPTHGTISYTAEYTNRSLVNDTWETYTVSKKREVTDYFTTVTVSGTVHGVTYLDTENDPSLRYQRARRQWDTYVKTALLGRAISESGITGLQPLPASAEVSDDPATGTVSYSYSFDSRPILSVLFEYSVDRSFSRERAETVVTVEGTITGMLTNQSDDPFAPVDQNEKYNNALAYFESAEPNLLGLAAYSVDTSDIFPSAWDKGRTDDPVRGVIKFRYSFTSRRVCFPGALSEVLRVSDENPVPVVAKFEIPGRSAGPLGQDMGTVTERRRTFAAEIVFPMPKVCGYTDPPFVDASPYAPKGGMVRVEHDTSDWQWSIARYSRQVTWVVYN